MTLNFAFWLSLVLATMGCAGLLLAGKGKWYGWGVGLAVQPVWATYAIVTRGYGLLLTCLMYGTVNARNLIRWRRSQVATPDGPVAQLAQSAPAPSDGAP